MKDMLQALLDFQSAGYKIDVVITSKDYLPLNVTVEEDSISLSDEDRVICTISATKTEGEGHIVIHLEDQQIDLMEQARERMREELL
ncbi:MAG: hypothetical protein OXN27_17070 [Candidatus Poribacteria bacterium]|nr:hypothetical protein [Candidatus Poribacteria bacterium]